MIAIIRSDASPSIGAGHVMRCMTLAESLRERDVRCIFASSEETRKTVPVLDARGFEVISPSEIPNVNSDLLIVDHYGLDKTYETSARAWAKKIAVIDDLANRPHNCDLLIDQTYGRKADDYKSLVPHGCHIFTGENYMILRPQFFLARQKAKERRAKNNALKRVLVAVGSTNLNNVVVKILEGLMLVSGQKLQIDVVLSSGASNLNGVENVISVLNNNQIHEAKLHLDVQDMASLMVEADIAIGAGGTTTWERCCLGLPTLMLELADNQVPTIDALTKVGAIIPIGHVDSLIPEKMASYFENNVISPSVLNNLADISFGICDGMGLERVVNALEKTCLIR